MGTWTAKLVGECEENEIPIPLRWHARVLSTARKSLFWRTRTGRDEDAKAAQRKRIGSGLRMSCDPTSAAREIRSARLRVAAKMSGLSVRDDVLDSTGAPLQLTPTETKLLGVLQQAPGVFLSRGALLRAVWGYYEDTRTRTLDTHVSNLREKLGDEGRHIKTVLGYGYVWVGDILSLRIRSLAKLR